VNPPAPPPPPPPSGVVKVWDASAGTEVQTIPAHPIAVKALAYSADGKRLATGGQDAVVKVFDATTGKEERQFFGHSGPITGVAFSADGNRLASSSFDQTAKVWRLDVPDDANFPGAHEPVTFKEHKLPVLGVAFNDENGGHLLASVGGEPGSPSGGGEVKVWNSFGGGEEFSLKGHTRGVRAVAYRSDGAALVTASDDGTVRVWDAGQRAGAQRMFGRFVAVSPDGRRIATAGTDQAVRVWDVRTGKQLLIIQGHAGPVQAVAFSPDGTKLVGGTARPPRGRGGLVAPPPPLRTEGEEPEPAAEPAPAAPEVCVWDAQSGKELLKLTGHTGDVRCVAFSPDGKRIASGGGVADRDDAPRDPVRMVEKVSGGEVKLWDAETGKELRSIKGYRDYVTGVAFSPDGSRLAAGSADQSVRVWGPETGDEVLALDGPHGEVNGIAYAPDGKQIAAAVGDSCVPDKPGEVVIWDAQTGKVDRVLRGHERQVNGVAYSGDGRRLVSGGGCGGMGGGGYAPTPGYGAYGGGPGNYGTYGCYGGGPPGGVGEVKVWDPRTGLELLNLSGAGTQIAKEVTEMHTMTVPMTVYRDEKRTRTKTVDGKQVTEEYIEKVPTTQNVQTCYPVTKKVLVSVSSCVASVAFSGDNQRIVCGDAAGGVQTFEAHLCQPHADLRMYAGVLRCVAYSPDGKRVATGGESGDTCNTCQPGEVKVWDALTGEELLSLRGHSGYVYGLAFSPDGTRLAVATGCVDQQKKPLPGEVKVWDLAGGSEPLTLKGHGGFVTGVAWAPDGSRLVSGSTDRTVKVWDARDGKPIGTISNQPADVNAVAFTPDGKWVVSAVGDRVNRDVPGEVRLWDAQTGAPVRTLKGLPGPAWCLALSADGKRIAAGCGVWDEKKHEFTRGEVRVWDAATGEEALTIEGHAAEVNGVSFGGGGRWIATAGGDWAVRVWDAENGGELLALKDHAGVATAVACSPDGVHLASAGADSFVMVWDVARARESAPHCKDLAPALGPVTYHSDLAPACVAFSPDGRRLAAGGMMLGGVGKAPQGPGEVVAPTPGGQERGWVKVWDAGTRRLVFDVQGHAALVNRVVWSPDGQRLASAAADGSIKVWDAAGKEQQAMMHPGLVALAFGPDGKKLLSAGRDRAVKFWDLQTGKEERTRPGPGAGELFRVAFSPDGRRAAGGHPDGTLRVWDLESGKEVFARKAHPTPIAALEFSPDGTRVATAVGVYDYEKNNWALGRVKVWDAATGERVQSLRGGGWDHALAFSGDGRLVAAAGADGVRLWDVKTGRPVGMIGGQSDARAIALGPDGSRVALGTYRGVQVWDGNTLPPAPVEDEGAAEAQRPEDRAAAEWVLKQGGIVQVRAEGAYQDVNKLDALPQEAFRVTAVDLGGRAVDDAALENLKGLADLKRLTLNDTPITGDGLRHLAASTRLEQLNLRHTKQLTDAALSHVGGMANLTELYLNLTPITDAGLDHLKGLRKVRVLHLGATAVTDAGLESLKDWPQLVTLLLEGTRVSGTGLAHLKASQGLAILYLQGCPISDEGLAQVAGFSKVAELYLNGKEVPLTDAGLAALEGLKNLQQLRLAGKITDAGLVHLKGLPRLRNLWLDNLPITEAGLQHLKGLRLEIIGLENTKVSKEAAEKFRQSLPKQPGKPTPGA
jgi:WD40 repeat protein